MDPPGWSLIPPGTAAVGKRPEAVGRGGVSPWVCVLFSKCCDSVAFAEPVLLLPTGLSGSVDKALRGCP